MGKIYNGFMAGIEEVEKSWGWLLGIGTLLMLLGSVCVGTARTANTVSILVFGWILVFSAVALMGVALVGFAGAIHSLFKAQTRAA